MSRLIEYKSEEGYIFNRWLYNRLIVRNKNVLGAELGPTGSGKSYRDLRKVELWYDFYFKERFPIENICFSIPQVMKLLSSGKLRKGEIIIFEEAGANLGSLDFQSKVSKMFNYVLQSFRSMNVAIFMNLPYFSMLNKQARMLLHYTFESVGINKETEMNICKPKFLQINQTSGKEYPKYMFVRNKKGKYVQMRKMAFGMPSKYLIDAYEQKKKDFLFDLTNEFNDYLTDMAKTDTLIVNGYHFRTQKEKEIAILFWEGKNGKEIAKIVKMTPQSVSGYKQRLKKRNIPVEERKILRENNKISPIN